MKRPLMLQMCLIVNMMTFGQIYPDYKLPVPEKVVFNHSCMEGNVSQIFQSVFGAGDPASANFMHVVSDAAGNIYFTGYSSFQTTPPVSPSYPAAGPAITFGSNTASPETRYRLNDYEFFLARYNSNGTLNWVNFFTEPPVKLLLDEPDDMLYVLFQASGNGLGFNGTVFPVDSVYTDKVIYSFETSEGIFNNFFSNRYIKDMVMADNRKILIYSRQLTPTNAEIRYGFFSDNQVTKWQTSLNGTSGMPSDLWYNPYQNSFWYTNNKMSYYRLFFHPSQDSLIAENVSRPLHYTYTGPFAMFNPITKFHFLPDENYLGEYYGNWGAGVYRPQLIKCDTVGTPIWTITFGDQPHYIGIYTLLIDPTGNLWIDLPTNSYSDQVHIAPINKKYWMQVYGNSGLLTSNLWYLDGQTGDILQAYHNGYGNLNYSRESSSYSYFQLLHLTRNNRLISTPQIGAVTYYPDATGKFIPYYTTCANNILPSQFLWLSFDLNNLQSFRKEELIFEEKNTDQVVHQNISVYPNPNEGRFTIHHEQGGMFDLMDPSGRVIQSFKTTHSLEAVQIQVPSGLYIIRERNTGDMQKIVVK